MVEPVTEHDGDITGVNVSQTGVVVVVGDQIFGSGIHNDFFKMAVPEGGGVQSHLPRPEIFRRKI
jgi:hypothetical protein